MNFTASTGQARIEAPGVPYDGMAPKRGSSRPSQPAESPRQEEEGDVAEPQAQRGNGTTWQADERGPR